MIMNDNPATIDHVFLIGTTEWSVRSFLPLFDDSLVFDTDVRDGFCAVCPLASYAHPMVRSDYDEYSYHKLCTLTAIKTGIVMLREVLADKGGCGERDPGSDYAKAMALISRIYKVPRKVHG
jgi:hypothetical protein